MEHINLLQFLNMAKKLYLPSYAKYDTDLVNLLSFIKDDDQFVKSLDLGLIFYSRKTTVSYEIVDGYGKLLSLSLLLHAVCECYKKTSPRNDNAIKIIRSKYLLNGEQSKLRLNKEGQTIYDKIIFGERLSGREKKSPIFKLLHELWSEIKSNELQASNIFNTLSKLTVYIVDTENVSGREVFYSLNKNKNDIDHLLMIESFLEEKKLADSWKHFVKIFNSKSDIKLFFKDFFVTKFNFSNYNENNLYDFFINYFNIMQDYQNDVLIMDKLTHSAKLYLDIVNVNLPIERLKKALIQIKMHNGEDTFAYLLNIYEDFIDGNISEDTFYEILITVDDYLKNRQKTPNDIDFNELIKYLNAFITCK